MRAITIPTPGDAEALVIDEIPTPTVAAGEVLVRVHTAGVNRADVLQRQGNYNPPAGATLIPGLEVSGTIESLGEGTESSGWSVGDEVAALLSGGGYAEFVNVPVGQLLPIPRGVSLRDAAAIVEVLSTVHSNVYMTARLQPGEWLLAHGGGSGIGTAAIQLAKATGNPIAVTVGSERKAEFCRELGADLVINYKEQDFVEEIKDATDGRGADVILDLIGAKYLERNIKALAEDGRLDIIGLQGGVKAEINLNALMRARKTVVGTTLRARPASQKAAIVSEVREHVWPLVEAGRIKPIVHSVVPLAEAPTAHTMLEDGSSIGKVLLTVQD